MNRRLKLMIFTALLAAASSPFHGHVASYADQPQPPSTECVMIYYSDSSGNGDICRIDTTKSPQAIDGMNSPATEWGPRWDRARQRLIAARDSDKGTHLVALNLKTGKVESLFTNPSDDEVPHWSPDGKYIAFSNKVNGNRDIYLADAHGKNVRRLTQHEADDAQPSWSPDSRRLAFVSNRSGNGDIFFFDLDSKQVSHLSQHPAAEGHPNWSPDGKSLVFDRTVDGQSDIFTIDLKTKKTTRITTNSGNDLVGRFSCDGATLSFGSNRDGNWDIFCYNFRTKQIERRIGNKGFDGDAIWITSLK